MGSLAPVLEALRSHRAPEDFSARHSWVKEDFERSFFRKRERLKVTLVETVDDLPTWSACEPDGDGDVMFRDLLAFFDQRSRHLLLAMRHGKTVSEIARGLGHKGHAAVARRVQAVKGRWGGCSASRQRGDDRGPAPPWRATCPVPALLTWARGTALG